jgi:hypothetical protein
MIIFKHDGINFLRTSEGKWICKAWAMRGPTGSMMNKEVPEKYAAPIEAAYQKQFTKEEEPKKKRGRKPKSPVNKADPIDSKLAKIKSKVKQKRKTKVEKKSTINVKKNSKKKVGVNGFNPFASK